MNMIHMCLQTFTAAHMLLCLFIEINRSFLWLPDGFIIRALSTEYFSSVLVSPSHPLSPAVKKSSCSSTPSLLSLSSAAFLVLQNLCSAWTPPGCDIHLAAMYVHAAYTVKSAGDRRSHLTSVGPVIVWVSQSSLFNLCKPGVEVSPYLCMCVIVIEKTQRKII